MVQVLQSVLPKGQINPYTELSEGAMIAYTPEFARGGSVDWHRDKENPNWGLVAILTLGQTRYLRVRKHLANPPKSSATKNKKKGKRTASDAEGEIVNVMLPDNSLVFMYGARFQKHWEHAVHKLPNEENVGTRLSLNFRFTTKGVSNHSISLTQIK